MQRLKKLLTLMFMLISFCFICMGIVHADSILNSVQYPVVESYLQHNTGKTFEDFRDLVMSKIPKPSDFDDYDNYVVYMNYDSSTNNNIVRLNFILSNDLSFGNRYDSLLLVFGASPNARGYGDYCVLKFNDDYTDLSWVRSSDYTTSCNNIFDGNLSPLNNRQILSSSTPTSRPDLWNMIISSNLNELNYSYSGWNTTTFDINGNTYPFNSTIPFNNTSYYSLSNFDYYSLPVPDKCSPSNFLGKFSNVSSFDVTIRSKTNALNGVVDGAFDIISSSYMTENDWNITYTSNDDDIIHAGVLSCITNRCVFRFTAGVEDDIDTDIILNYHFEPVSGVAMPTTIQIDTCYDSDFYINTTYIYVNDDSNNDGNIVIPSTDNFLQDGTLPNISGLSNTDIIPDGPVDSILLLPLNIMQSLLNVLNSSTCSPVVVPIPFSNSNLSLPCISTIYAKIGTIEPMFTSFLSWFSAIVSAFILYQYFIYLYKWVDDTLTFRENNHFGGY